MHEVSIAEGILSAVKSTLVNEPQAKVTSVTVSIGELAGIEIQALLFAWDSVTRGTLADESKLVINRVAGEAWCMKCAKNVALHRHGDPCPSCGGYQLMGQYYKDSNGEKVPGLGLFDYYTVASTDKRCRCIGNIVIEAQLDGEKYKVIGFENHGGQTTNVKSPFGKVLSGNGNEFESSTEGYMEKSVIATYLHGPLLSKNPKVSDYVISYCMSRKLGEKYIPAPINDKLEEDCRKQLFERLGV